LREKSVATESHVSGRSIPLDMAVVTNVAVLSYCLPGNRRGIFQRFGVVILAERVTDQIILIIIE
jgi:hypothetical protein